MPIEAKEKAYEIDGKVWTGNELDSVIRRIDGSGKVHLRVKPEIVEARPDIFKTEDIQRGVEAVLRDLGPNASFEDRVAYFSTLIELFSERAIQKSKQHLLPQS